jgi:hypothetical protein
MKNTAVLSSYLLSQLRDGHAWVFGEKGKNQSTGSGNRPKIISTPGIGLDIAVRVQCVLTIDNVPKVHMYKPVQH